MEKIKIAHLYYDLMNLYGENGNIRALTNNLEKSAIQCEVHFLSIDDKIDFEKYDLFYIGMGSETNQQLVIQDLNQYKQEIKNAVENNKFFLVTGNAIEMFGQFIEKLDDTKIPCLNTFKYYTKETDFRIVGEQVFTTSLIKNTVIGFQNRSGVIKECSEYLFEVQEGTGYEPKNKLEGIKYKNFYGTYLLGPLLIRNPYFNDYLITKLLKSKNLNYKPNSKSIEYIAYEEYLKNFVNS